MRTMVLVSWQDGPRRSDVAAVVDRYRAPLALMSAELVCVREFSEWARSIIAPGPARLPGDFWVRAAVQDFDLRPIVDLLALLEYSRREVRISARARALAAA